MKSYFPEKKYTVIYDSGVPRSSGKSTAFGNINVIRGVLVSYSSGCALGDEGDQDAAGPLQVNLLLCSLQKCLYFSSS